MSVNKERPHLYVLPEDDANRQLANGFYLDHSLDTRRMYILRVAGGWTRVLDSFRDEHVPMMDRYSARFMVLLVDFDDMEHRLEIVRAAIPERLTERVFVLGTRSQPERLRQAIDSYESIGKALARDCRDDTQVTWSHELLRHNAGELERLRTHVRPFLFQGA